MIICIPTTTAEGKTAPVHEHFGSAPFYTLCDTETDKVEVISNSDHGHAHGMCQPLSLFADRHIDAVVCGGMGARAVQKLNQSGIRAYQAISRHGCRCVGAVCRQPTRPRLPRITPVPSIMAVIEYVIRQIQDVLQLKI